MEEIITPRAILHVFGSDEQIEEIVKDFDFSRLMTTRVDHHYDYLTTALAPSFGSLDRESIKLMNEQLKIMIAGTTRTISKMPPQDRTWNQVVSALKLNPHVEPAGDEIVREDNLIKTGWNIFRVGSSRDPMIIREVKTWFTNLIRNEDVLEATPIDIGAVADIVAKTGAGIKSPGTIIFREREHTQTLMDIGVLRYPDLENPYIKVYRIILKAWSHCKCFTTLQCDKNGITGEFRCRRFIPRESFIASLKETKEKAIKEAESLFEGVAPNMSQPTIFYSCRDDRSKAAENLEGIAPNMSQQTIS